MKKAWKIVVGIFVILIIFFITVLVWQWDNINALYSGITSSEAKIEERIEENKQKFTEILENEELFDKKVIDGFSKEDEEKIAKGEISVEEAVEKLFDEEPQKAENGNEPPEEINPDEKKEVQVKQEIQDEADKKQKELMQTAVKEMYILKATFTKRLAELEREGKRMYIADNGKNMTMENKLKIADYLMPQFVQAEKDCDSKVEVVLKTLEDGLKNLRKDTSVVDTIRAQYKEEKQLKKTQYIKQYL